MSWPNRLCKYYLARLSAEESSPVNSNNHFSGKMNCSSSGEGANATPSLPQSKKMVIFIDHRHRSLGTQKQHTTTSDLNLLENAEDERFQQFQVRLANS